MRRITSSSRAMGEAWAATRCSSKTPGRHVSMATIVTAATQITSGQTVSAELEAIDDVDTFSMPAHRRHARVDQHLRYLQLRGARPSSDGTAYYGNTLHAEALTGRQRQRGVLTASNRTDGFPTPCASRNELRDPGPASGRGPLRDAVDSILAPAFPPARVSSDPVASLHCPVFSDGASAMGISDGPFSDGPSARSPQRWALQRGRHGGRRARAASSACSASSCVG